MDKLEIRVDVKRLQELVTVDQLIGLNEGDLRCIRDVLGQFVVSDGGGYLPAAEGIKLVGKLTLAQLVETAQIFRTGAERAAVPLVSNAG